MEVVGGQIYVEFHVDSIFEGPEAWGGPKQVVLEGQRSEMWKMYLRPIPIFDPTPDVSKSIPRDPQYIK